MPGRQIHDAVGAIQEGIHTIHTKGLKSVVLKIDLSKAYDRVSWIFLRVILTKMGFGVPFITWVMSSLTSVSFSVMINEVASCFLGLAEDLDKGVLLHLCFFLLLLKD